MTIGSLFSGIGGLEMGLGACGMGPVVWQCDSDPYARAVLAEHWPDVRRYNDVKEIDGNAARVDLVCGGFPCQPHSLAGKRRGMSDARWLWPEFARIIADVRPSAVFIENVPGLRTSGLSTVLADLAALGFDAEWGCFSACEVGAPHSRRRLFVLAYSDGKLGETRVWTWKGGRGRSLPGSDNSPVQPPFWLAPDADVHLMANGIHSALDARQHKLYGNAVVPAQAAYAFQALAARASNPKDPTP